MAVNKSIVDWKTITSFVVDAFVGYGIPREDAEICADVLLESDKRGIESHGVNRFKPIYLDRIKAGIQSPVTNFEIVKETPPPRWSTVTTAWVRSSATSPCRWRSTRRRSMAWAWSSSAIPAITASRATTPPWPPSRAASA